MTAGLSNEANALLERAKRQGGPSAAQTAKIGAAVFAATTATAAAATATTAATTATVATTASTGSSLITIVGAGLVATALGIGGTVAVKHALTPPAQQPPRPRVAVAPANAPQAPKPIVPVALPSEPPPAEPAQEAPPTTEPKQPPVAATRVKREVAEPAEPTATPRSAEPTVAPTPDLPEAEPTRSTHHELAQPDSTAAQVAALTAAVDALERHEPEFARVTAREARLADPRGVLSPELMVVEITALCELGRRDDALTLSRQMSSAEQTPLVRGKLGRTCVGTGQ